MNWPLNTMFPADTDATDAYDEPMECEICGEVVHYYDVVVLGIDRFAHSECHNPTDCSRCHEAPGDHLVEGVNPEDGTTWDRMVCDGCR